MRKDQDDIPVPVRCVKCGTVNMVGVDYCSQCNSPLSAKAVMNAESRERYIRKKYEQEQKVMKADMATMREELDELRAGRYGQRLREIKQKN